MARLGKVHNELLLASEVRSVICYFSVSVPLLCWSLSLTSFVPSSSGLPSGQHSVTGCKVIWIFHHTSPCKQVLSSFLNKRSVGFQRQSEGVFSSSLSNLHAQVVQGQWGLKEPLLKVQELAETSSSLFIQLGHSTVLSLKQPFPLLFPSGIQWLCPQKLCPVTTPS